MPPPPHLPSSTSSRMPPSSVTVFHSSAMQHLPLLSLLVLLPYTTAWPKERLQVNYWLEQGDRQKVLPQEGNLVTKVSLEEEPTSLLSQVEGRELAATPGAYRETVSTLIGQMERAARSADTSVQILLHLL